LTRKSQRGLWFVFNHLLRNILIGTKENALNLVTSDLVKLLSPEIAGFCWSGVYLGMYSSGNSKKCCNQADFNWFYYKVNQ
jgi:hypothetical protein